MDPNGPALTPPEGIDSNFDNPPNNNPLVLAIITVSLAISSVFLFIRMFSKCVYFNGLKAEDILILPAYLFFVAYSVYVYRVIATTGFFVHAWDIRFGDLAEFYHNLFYVTNFYLATMIFLKPAILVEWTRIFVPGMTRNAFFWTCNVVALLNALYYTANIIVENVSCMPKAFWWDKSIEGGHCLNGTVLALTSATVNLAFDTVIFILPQKVIWTLNISPARRLGVSIIFVIGLLAVALAATRLAASVTYIKGADYTYNLGPQILLQTAEMAAGFLIFTVHTLPKPVVDMMQRAGSAASKLTGSRRSNTDNSGSNTGVNSSNGGSGGGSNHFRSARKRSSSIEEQGLVRLGRLGKLTSKDSFSPPHHHAHNESGDYSSQADLSSTISGNTAAAAEAGILRTTQLTTIQSFVANNKDGSWKDQHPWIE